MQRQVIEEQIRHDYTAQGRRKIPGITGIRGIAACWVVLFHYFRLSNSHIRPTFLFDLPVIGRGYLGVDLFFLLSGFVLFLTYNKRMSIPQVSEIKNFFIARIFRVFPLHLVVLSCFAAVLIFIGPSFLFEGNGPYNLKTFMLSAFLVQSWAMQPLIWNSPAWSLSNELLAYIFFPLLIGGTRRVRSWRLAITYAAGAFAFLTTLCAISPDPGFDHIKRIGMLRCLVEFPVGMLLCRILQLKTFNSRIASQFFVIGLTLLSISMLDVRLDLLSLPAFCFLILSCAIGSPLVDRIFGNKICHWLGEVSYSIYIIHFLFLEVAVQFATTYLGNSTVAAFLLPAIAGLAVLPIAYLTWRYIEVPGQALGRKLIARRTPAPTTGSASATVGFRDQRGDSPT
jgi:peptidoglycan/LPS O-acetylase OafA/YrhL